MEKSDLSFWKSSFLRARLYRVKSPRWVRVEVLQKATVLKLSPMSYDKCFFLKLMSHSFSCYYPISLSLPRAESKQLILDRLQRTDPFGDPLEFDDHIGTLLHGEEPPVAEEISQPPEEVSTLITALFEVPKFQIQLQVELRDEEQEFANIVLEDFFLSFSNVAKPLTEITVHLGGMSVEDLLHKGNPAYKYLLCSSNTRDQSSRGPNLSSLSRLSYSCPETSLLSSNPILSSSLPSVLYQSPKKTTQRVLSPLRPMISPRKYPSQPQLQSSQEEDDGSVDEQHSLGLTPREQAWVEVKVTVVDKDSKEFRETYKSVRMIYTYLCY